MSDTLLASEWLSLSPAQLDFWEEFSLHPDKPFATIAHATTLQGKVDKTALIQAITRTLAETQAFSVRFATGGAYQAVQQLDSTCQPKLQHIDLRDYVEPEKAAQQLMQEDIACPLDLYQRPIVVSWLISLSNEHVIWYLRTHHILIDGFGMALVEHRCAALYAHYLCGNDAGNPPGCYHSLLYAEQDYLNSERFMQDRLFWQHYLAEGPALPRIRKGGEDYGVRAISSSHRLSDEISSCLLQLSTQRGLSWPDVLLTLNTAWLYFTFPADETDSAQTMWMPALNRRLSAVADVPGLTVNTVPMRIKLTDETVVSAYLAEMTKTLRKLRRHAGYRLRQTGIDHGLDNSERLFVSPYINIQPFDTPTYQACQSTRRVLAGGAGDGINLTFRSNSDATDLHLEIEIFTQQCSAAEKERDIASSLQRFLLRALHPDAFNATIRSLMR